jgi:adenylate cyclase
MPKSPVFVGRQGELSRLNHALEKSMAGQGNVCFITGNAGSGKTALINAFTHQALTQHKDLIAAIGLADATTGAGDPYLPFREILSQLTGDVEAKLTQGAISQDNALRLRKLLGLSGEAIAELGPDLIGIFIPGAGLIARTAAFAAGKAGWIEKLKKSSDRASLDRKLSMADISQAHIFEQYTNVLRKIAKKHSLVLILDDLHWADTASCELLFHLSRRIQGYPILILGTYRPEEITFGRQTEHHPLEKVINELKRYFGDIFIELDQLPEEEMHGFVGAFIDSEPNLLGEDFRGSLFSLTNGHPLFTIELLRNMQERGDLVRDTNGNWITSSRLTWDELPTRVEGVIEERLNRLVDELRQALEIGSVEGETFTAEIVARVQSSDTRKLIRSLSGEIEKKHQLVVSQGIQSLAKSRISLYRFQHNLFQRYLYHELDEAERSYLHEDVGRVMEELFIEDTERVAIQLAHHFSLAGLKDKALPYLRIAGEQALARFANQEALQYFTHALELTSQDDVEMQYRLHLRCEQIFNILGDRTKQKKELESLDKLSKIMDEASKKSEVALIYAGYSESIGEYAEAIQFIEKSLTSAKSVNDIDKEARAYHKWGYIKTRQGNYKEALGHLEQALDLAKAAQETGTEASALREMGVIGWRQGNYQDAERHFRQALSLFTQMDNQVEAGSVLSSLGNLFLGQERFEEAKEHYQRALIVDQQAGEKRGEVANLGNLGIIAAMEGNFTNAYDRFKQILDISGEINDRESEGRALGNLGGLLMDPGFYHEANDTLSKALDIFQSIGSQTGCCWMLADLGLNHLHLGQLEQAWENCNNALRIAEKIGNKHFQNTAMANRAHVLIKLNRLDEAKVDYQNSLKMNIELENLTGELDALAGLTEISQAEGNLQQALDYVEQILEKFDPIQVRYPEARSKILLDCYHALKANHDARCKSVLHKAYMLLMDQADKYEDEEHRRSFMENVQVNNQIYSLVNSGALDP